MIHDMMYGKEEKEKAVSEQKIAEQREQERQAKEQEQKRKKQKEEKERKIQQAKKQKEEQEQGWQLILEALKASKENNNHSYAPQVYLDYFAAQNPLTGERSGYCAQLTKERATYLHRFMQSDINLKCFFDEGDGSYQKDDCILQRRKKGAAICFFDYKRFLPESSKTQTDDEFIYLVKATEYYFANNLCQHPELTSSERKTCEKNAEEYIKQLSEKRAVLCRKAHPKEYREKMQKLKNDLSKELLKYKVDYELSTGKEQVMKELFGGNSHLIAMYRNSLLNFGYANLCYTDNKDMEELNKEVKSIEEAF